MRSSALIVSFCMSLAACNQGPDSPRGFSLPEGDIERGKAVFASSGCLSCHEVKGLESNDVLEIEKPVVIGGKVTRVKTYGELVTSVINPSHRISRIYAADDVSEGGQSKMRNYNDLLTVSQLVDLVTFLETHYELVAYRPTRYGVYHPISGH